jgi:hypothetical protein
MAFEEEAIEGSSEREVYAMERTTRWASCRFLFGVMLAVLLGGCEFAEDPCTQHIGINGYEPFYYYTGDCGEGVTGATKEYPTVPYSVHFEESFLSASSREGASPK